MGVESLAKAYILTHGVQFSASALSHADSVGAKRQNMVYNLPTADQPGGGLGHSVRPATIPKGGETTRPQELFLKDYDGYTVCVSAVAPVEGRECAAIDFVENRLVLTTPEQPDLGHRLAAIDYVLQPAYYGLRTASGRP